MSTSESVNLSDTIAPRSDQANAEDFLDGPRTVTVEKVTRGSVEQPVNIHLVEFPGRPFKPSKTVRRILVAAWGSEAANYTGRRMTLYRDPEVRFGGAAVGGIRVSHLSHISKPLTISLTETRGKRKPHRIDPLPDAPPPLSEEKAAEFEQRIADATTTDDLNAIAKDLKSVDLGAHRKRLGDTWSARNTALKEAEPPTCDEIDELITRHLGEGWVHAQEAP